MVSDEIKGLDRVNREYSKCLKAREAKKILGEFTWFLTGEAVTAKQEEETQPQPIPSPAAPNFRQGQNQKIITKMPGMGPPTARQRCSLAARRTSPR